MQAATEKALDHHANEAQRIGSAVTDLNMRIARLAIALGIRLDQSEDVHRVLHHELSSTSHHPESDRHRAHAYTELRGLLVMRYDIEKHLIEDMGLQLSRRILEDAELHLAVAGFKPGVDGLSLDLHDLFGTDQAASLASPASTA